MLTCVNLWEAHVAYIDNSAIYTSRCQWHVYLGGSATYISAAVRHLSRRQCHACLGGGATYYIGSSVMYVLTAALRLSQCSATLSQRQCDVYFGGSVILSRRQCNIYLDGSVTHISTAVSFLHMCEGLVFVCSILLNMQCCDNNCG